MKLKQFIIGLISLFVCSSMSYTVNSQVLISLLFGDELNSDRVKFGLDGGFNFSSLTGLDHAKFVEDFNLGLYFDILLKENSHWYLHTGALLKSEMGARGIDTYSLDDHNLDSVFIGGDVEKQLKYINIPALVRYKLKKHIFFEIGPMIGFMTKATDEFYNVVKKDEDVSLKRKVTDQYKWFDAGIEAGMGYQLLKGTGVNFGIRYYQGLMDIFRENSSSAVRNQSIYLFVSIPVGAGEKAQAKKAEKAAKKNEGK